MPGIAYFTVSINPEKIPKKPGFVMGNLIFSIVVIQKISANIFTCWNAQQSDMQITCIPQKIINYNTKNELIKYIRNLHELFKNDTQWY